MMWADTPMELLSLYGLEVEQPSVPTVFASATHAWDALPEELRRQSAACAPFTSPVNKCAGATSTG